jgi:hypothetical protein
MIRLFAVMSLALLVTACATHPTTNNPGNPNPHHTPSLSDFNTPNQPTHSSQAAETAARMY